MKHTQFIGASVGHCAGVVGCEQAPDLIKEKFSLAQNWYKTVYYQGQQRKLDALNDLAQFSQELAKATVDVIKNGNRFITIGGDHSCAIGTWSGVHEAIGEFGLIWIDAHMDSHTPESTHTGNLHGMPIAALLGHGDKKLTSILSPTTKIKPENIVLIGIRSYEKEEQALLEKLGVKVYMVEEANQLGFIHCFDSALKHFQSKNLPFGVSFDLDGLEPSDVLAIGTPVDNGLRFSEVLPALKALPNEETLIGVEIVEYNPTLDQSGLGLQVMQQVLEALNIQCDG